MELAWKEPAGVQGAEPPGTVKKIYRDEQGLFMVIVIAAPETYSQPLTLRREEADRICYFWARRMRVALTRFRTRNGETVTDPGCQIEPVVPGAARGKMYDTRV